MLVSKTSDVGSIPTTFANIINCSAAEGIEADLPEDKDAKVGFIIDFVNRFHHADDFTLTEDNVYAWWD